MIYDRLRDIKIVTTWMDTSMPVISVFYGIAVLMYYVDNKRHQKPHIHVRYQG